MDLIPKILRHSGGREAERCRTQELLRKPLTPRMYLGRPFQRAEVMGVRHVKLRAREMGSRNLMFFVLLVTDKEGAEYAVQRTLGQFHNLEERFVEQGAGGSSTNIPSEQPSYTLSAAAVLRQRDAVQAYLNEILGRAELRTMRVFLNFLKPIRPPSVDSSVTSLESGPLLLLARAPDTYGLRELCSNHEYDPTLGQSLHDYLSEEANRLRALSYHYSQLQPTSTTEMEWQWVRDQLKRVRSLM
eukprot:CAMPEP_0119130890 /NCGR_PEP_ID=MMETSP1310-20130426/9022_1 /TAXON_ID=464262 /ORGANISM="Genus nov. species nov., Strain RCC2339" /LENGTH=243 /DNA_ID=CAMNT_0007121429 /DNA_START=221 /DNA_END=952 /DNA_ORIENTATION=-